MYAVKMEFFENSVTRLLVSAQKDFARGCGLYGGSEGSCEQLGSGYREWFGEGGLRHGMLCTEYLVVVMFQSGMFVRGGCGVS